MKRADVDDSMVLVHPSARYRYNSNPQEEPPCRLAQRAFYPAAVHMAEIKGAVNGEGLFVPEWERQYRSGKAKS